jgi:hypothetical protein
MAETEAGFYLEIEPVQVASASDTEALQTAIKEIVSKGNPVVATPSRATFPKPFLQRYAKVKSWSAFEREAQIWKVVEEAGIYRIKQGRKHASGRGWEDDPAGIESLPSGTTLDAMVKRFAFLLRSALSNHETKG